jgi:nucleoside-diphosphate-sugar epimerase
MIILTGSSGFIGQNFLNHLQEPVADNQFDYNFKTVKEYLLGEP